MANLGTSGSRYSRPTPLAALIHVSSLLHRLEALWPLFSECEPTRLNLIITISSGVALDLALAASLAKSLTVPMIVYICCAFAKHFLEGYQAGSTAVAAVAFLCQPNQNPLQCRSHIRNACLPIRLEV